MKVTMGINRFSKAWETTDINDENLEYWVNHPITTFETNATYQQMKRIQKESGKTQKIQDPNTKRWVTTDDLKDQGGMLCGELIESPGPRRESNIKSRSMIAFDLDDCTKDFFETLKNPPSDSPWAKFDWHFYTTHTHTPERPRVRILIPLDRAVSKEEYEPCARKVAEKLNLMDMVDPASFKINQLMYRPSHSVDGEYISKSHYQNVPRLKATAVLKLYQNWHNRKEYPLSKAEENSFVENTITRNEKGQIVNTRTGQPLKDPTKMSGVPGAFNRAYTIEDSIDTYLSQVYEPTNDPKVYHFVGSSSQAGIKIYDTPDGSGIAVSYHQTDPAHGRRQTAFTAMQYHLYGFSQEAYLKACEKALDDPNVQAHMTPEDFRQWSNTQNRAMLHQEAQKQREMQKQQVKNPLRKTGNQRY